jgi:3-deoxy-7-phosphoheptulonate synthase
MAPPEVVPADQVLEVSRRIADRLLDVQRRVNALIDATQSELLPEVRRQLGSADTEAVDLDGLVNTRIAGLSSVVTPEAVATLVPLSAASAATTRAGRRAMTDVLAGTDGRLAVIAGPCSIHDPVATLEYAEFVRRMRDRHAADLEIVMRTYTEKPRTEVDWKGFAYDPFLDGSNQISVGLIATRLLMCRITALGVPVAAEPLNALTPRATSPTRPPASGCPASPPSSASRTRRRAASRSPCRPSSPRGPGTTSSAWTGTG